MKIKRFNEMADFDLANNIAEDLLPKLQQKRSDGEIITPEYFENFIFITVIFLLNLPRD